MNKLTRRLPSPAMVVALMALFGSLGGVSYGLAKGSIDSREIRNGTIRSKDVRNNGLLGKDVKPNSIGGKRVKESSLGEVPKATNATAADLVDGHHLARVDFRAPSNTESTQILALGGLVLNATCTNAGDLNVTAGSTTDDGIIHVGTIGPGGSSNVGQDNDFDTGQSQNVLPGDDTGVRGSLTYVSRDGPIVTVEYLAEEQTDALNSTVDCVFAGRASVSG